MELLFERFLSEVRGEWPDIDLDLPSGEDREKAIQYVYTRYGQLGAAMCANVITYRGKSAAREVGKSLGFDEDTLTRLTRLVSCMGVEGRDRHDAGAVPRRRVRPRAIRASPSTLSFRFGCSTCRAIWASTQAA